MASFGESSPMMTGSSMPPLQLGQIWGRGYWSRREPHRQSAWNHSANDVLIGMRNGSRRGAQLPRVVMAGLNPAMHET